MSVELRLGGVWRDYQDRILLAEKQTKSVEEKMLLLVAERDLLISEKTELLEKFKKSLASLTTTETRNLESKQIIEQVKVEQENISKQLAESESYIVILEQKLLEGNTEQSRSATEIGNLTLFSGKLQQMVKEIGEDNVQLRNLIKYQAEEIERLKYLVSSRGEELLVMSRAVNSKDKQIVSLIKEKNELKDNLVDTQKSLRGNSTNCSIRGPKLLAETSLTNVSNDSMVHNLRSTLMQQKAKSVLMQPMLLDDVLNMVLSQEKIKQVDLSDEHLSPVKLFDADQNICTNQDYFEGALLTNNQGNCDVLNCCTSSSSTLMTPTTSTFNDNTSLRHITTASTITAAGTCVSLNNAALINNNNNTTCNPWGLAKKQLQQTTALTSSPTSISIMDTTVVSTPSNSFFYSTESVAPANSASIETEKLNINKNDKIKEIEHGRGEIKVSTYSSPVATAATTVSTMTATGEEELRMYRSAIYLLQEEVKRLQAELMQEQKRHKKNITKNICKQSVAVNTPTINRKAVLPHSK